MSNPTLLQMPLAVNGDKNTIPVETGSNTGLFSQKYGFQSINSLPLSAGGKAISRHDYNGAMYLLSNILFYAQKGYTFEFDSTQDYFTGCEVIDSTDGNKYRCIADVAAEGDSPSEDTTHWERIFNESAFFYRMPSTTYVVGDVKYTANLPSWGFLTCITGGVAGSGELVIPAGTKAGDTITDGQVVWRLDSFVNMKKALAESTGYGIVSGCEPTISGLTVTVGAGVVHLADGTRKELSATNITLDAADSTNPRIDLVYIDSTGAVAKITGTAAASPVVPSVPANGISVTQVSVAANATTGTITDMRSMLPRVYNAGVVNVKDFGGVGNIGAIINQIINANPNGVKIYIPAGDYSLETPVVINKSNIKIIGELGNTNITVKANINAVITISGNSADRIRYCEISNLNILCDNKAEYGIYTDDVWLAYSTLKNITVNASITTGISLQAFMTQLINCTISETQNGLLMPMLNDVRGTSCTLTNCYAMDCNVGITVNLWYSTLINCASDRNDIGYYIKNCRGVDMINCGAENTVKLIKVGTLWGGAITGFYAYESGDTSLTQNDNLIEMYSPVNVTIEGFYQEELKGNPTILEITSGTPNYYENVTILDNSITTNQVKYPTSGYFQNLVKFMREENYIHTKASYYNANTDINVQTNRENAIATVLTGDKALYNSYAFTIRYYNGFYATYIANYTYNDKYDVLEINSEKQKIRLYSYDKSNNTCTQKTASLN